MLHLSPCVYVFARTRVYVTHRKKVRKSERKKERSVSLEEEEEEEEAGKRKKKLELFSLLSFSLSPFFFSRGDTSRPYHGSFKQALSALFTNAFGKLALYILRLAAWLEQ